MRPHPLERELLDLLSAYRQTVRDGGVEEPLSSSMSRNSTSAWTRSDRAVRASNRPSNEAPFSSSSMFVASGWRRFWHAVICASHASSALFA